MSSADAPVHWLKDREAVITMQVLAICSEGRSQRLHIAAAALPCNVQPVHVPCQGQCCQLQGDHEH